MTSETLLRQRIFPSMRYRDPRAALRFLTEAFGFTEEQVHEQDGQIVYVEVSYAGNMLGFGVLGVGHPAFDVTPSCVYVVVDDVDTHYRRAVSAGAEIVMEPADQDYGSRTFVARDLEGNVWAFGTYQPAPRR